MRALSGILFVSLLILIWIVLRQRRILRYRTGTAGEQSAMSAEQERFRILFEQSSDAHLLVDTVGVIDCNAATVNMLGARDKQQLIGIHPARFSPERQPDGQLSSEQSIEMVRLAHEKGYHRFDWLHQRFDGTPFLCEVTITPVKIGGHSVLLVVFHDLTARNALDERVRLLSSVVREADSLIVIIDAAQRIVYANPAFERASGYSLAELQGHPARRTVIAESDTPADCMRQICQHINERTAITAEIVSRHKNGTAYWVEAHVAPVFDATGLCTHFVAIGHDITERRRAAHLKEAQTRLLALGANIGRAITNSVSLPDMLTSCTAALVEHLDAAFVRIWTYDPAENMLLLRASSGLYTHLDGPHGRVPVGKFKIGLIAEERKPHLTNDVQNDPRVGDPAWARREGMIAFAGYPLLIEGELLGVVALFARHALDSQILDALASTAGSISLGIRRWMTEERLLQSKIEAEAGARAKGEFLAVMSHEIRTPMNGVIGMAHLMLDTQLTATQRSYLDTIRSCGQFLLTIINDILDLSKIEAGKIALEHVEFDLRAVLNESIELVAAPAAQKGLRILLEVGEEVPINLVGDAGRIRQILLNLLSNATKFTEQGTVGISVVREAADDKMVHLRFSVRDTGIGLSTEQQQSLFQNFSQADSSTTRRFGGTGLGLSIAKRLVQLMGGSIGVSSELGQGATFWFNVCLQPASATLSGVPVDVRAWAEGSAGLRNVLQSRGGLVLVADDVSTNQQVALGILKMFGLRADAVANGAEVIEALKTIPYELVLMDVRMPLMDGLEATRRIRSAESAAASETPNGSRHLPIIAVTAGAMEGEREHCLRAGMDDFLSKPIVPEALAQALAKWLPACRQENEKINAGRAKISSASSGPPSSIFDMDALLRRLMGDKQLAGIVLNAFLQDMPREIQALANVLNEGGLEEVERQAHKIRGAAANVSGESLSALAGEIEKAAQQRNAPALVGCGADLNREFVRLQQAIVACRES